ncbi:MAG: gfo/Idh/MocA family oxidoreductase, partial [Gemmatimonadota bacterium]|nr:gfo/Idh/MocA family oxidoreductase [Gemmatimonadota bacterium]
MTDTLLEATPEATSAHARPRLGFLGVGWIGRHRMEAIARSGAAEVAMVADASAEMLDEAQQAAPGAERA